MPVNHNAYQTIASSISHLRELSRATGTPSPHPHPRLPLALPRSLCCCYLLRGNVWWSASHTKTIKMRWI